MISCFLHKESMTNHATHRYTPIEKILDEPLPGTNVGKYLNVFDGSNVHNSYAMC